jgi:orotate phosphoribosyltransferase
VNKKEQFFISAKGQGLLTVKKMLTVDQARSELLNLLGAKSVFHGEFTLASGAKSNYYFDCRLTTHDPKGAWLTGQLVHSVIRREEAARKIKVAAVGGLTMGADPVALAAALFSYWAGDAEPLQAFSVRKAPKAHGQTKLIEGNLRSGDTAVVVDDVVTRGDSTIAAIDAVTKQGATVAFVVVLVDRREGGRERIEALGYSFFALFTRDELLGRELQAPPPPKA